MKYLLFLLPIFAQSQINKIDIQKNVVGSYKNGATLQAELSYSVDKDTTYLLLFSDLQYQTITDYKTVSFKGNPDDLYNIIKDVFNTGKDQNLQLGEDLIFLKKSGSNVTFFKGPSFFYITKKQLEKLFGKD